MVSRQYSPIESSNPLCSKNEPVVLASTLFYGVLASLSTHSYLSKVNALMSNAKRPVRAQLHFWFDDILSTKRLDIGDSQYKNHLANIPVYELRSTATKR